MNNKVIIIGGSQANTLGVIRAFGENNISSYVFLIGEIDDYILTSKYIHQYWLCDDETSAVAICLELFSKEGAKPIIIPTSDKAASYLDGRFRELSQFFILHNINHQDNLINYYMDKFHQYQLFCECNIPCLKTQLIQPQAAVSDMDIPVPCILKPHISAKGDKMDIEICKTTDELTDCLSSLSKKKYTEILLQEYLEYDTEYDVAGFVFDHQVCLSGMIKKMRIWPKDKGSTTFGEVCPINKTISEMIETVLLHLQFEGIFDIEIFEKNGSFFINEINFRNSAVSYAYADSHPAYFWYRSASEGRFLCAPEIKKSYLFMNEQVEIHQILDKNISLFQYLKNRKQCQLLIVKNKQDPAPSKAMTKNRIKRLTRRV